MTELFQEIRASYRQFSDQLEALQQLGQERLALAERLEREAGMDLTKLQDFLQRPYLLRHIKSDRYELIVPNFLDLRAGWPSRIEGNYVIYEVSRFVDLMNPLPDWLRQEVGFAPPEFLAELEGDQLHVLEGDAGLVWSQMGGKRVFSSRRGNVLYVRPKSRFDVIRELVRSGILPYKPEPVPVHLLRQPKTNIQLRPKQARDYERFLELGAVAVVATGGAGKSYFGMYAASCLSGPKLVLAPRLTILDQWQMRMQAHCPQVLAETEFMTYQALLHRYKKGNKPKRRYSLIVYDEIQTLPSNAGVAAASLNSVARIGLSATPWREDGREDLIIALCGFPLGGDWESAPAPEATVWVVQGSSEKKVDVVRKLLQQEVRGKTLIFVYRLAVGERLADELRLPFVHGGTQNPLNVLAEHDTAVVSKIADAGVSLDAQRVIEVDWLGGRMEMGQRALRTRHAEGGGEFHAIVTKTEYGKHQGRLSALFAIGADVRYTAV